MVELYANSGDPDLMPHFAVSDLGLHCLPITLLGLSRLQWVKNSLANEYHNACFLGEIRKISIFFVCAVRMSSNVSYICF